MQPYFFPYLGYFQLIHAAKRFLLYDLVQFQKRSYMTRNFLVDASNRPYPIKIPVEKAPTTSLINEMRLSESWDAKYLTKKIKTIYARSPYFFEVYPCIEYILHFDTRSLSAFNCFSIQQLCTLLSIPTELVTTNDIRTEAEVLEWELSQIKRDKPVRGERVGMLCHLLGADTYINPEGGIHLYSKQYFQERNIDLKFSFSTLCGHRSGHPQLKYASIIDVLMMHGIENTKGMLAQSILK
jgi:hypothetical protein